VYVSRESLHIVDQTDWRAGWFALSEKQGGTQEAILLRLGLGTHLYGQLVMPKMGS